MTAVLDTHAVIWALENDKRLGSQARKLMASAQSKDVSISDMTLLEISILAHKKRINLSTGVGDYLKKIETLFEVIPVNAAISAKAFELDLPQADPFDRVIVATAAVLKLPLVTRDGYITRSNIHQVIW